MVSATNQSKAKGKANSKVGFGKYHEYAQVGSQIKQAHELTRKEKELLIGDFKKVKAIEKEGEAELKALKHFEKKLQELIENVVYLEGYIQQIEEGNSMLKISPSVKELGTELKRNIEEIEKLSSSILKEEGKIMGLAKHVKKVLSKAKEYQAIIFN